MPRKNQELTNARLPKVDAVVDLNQLSEFEQKLFDQTYAASIAAINASKSIMEARRMELYFASLLQTAIYFGKLAVKVHRDMEQNGLVNEEK